MKKPKVMILISLSLIFLFCTVENFARLAQASKRKTSAQQNHVPVVKIISPANNSSFSSGSQVHYSISVSDEEDGDSKYDEINAKEVFVEMKYFSDASKLSSNRNQNDVAGLFAMRTSNCFNCHGFENKATGPSFIDISKRYKPTSGNIALLTKRIKDGSTGVWGKTAMPTHPELTNAQMQAMIEWILQNGSDASLHYYSGTEGMFNLQANKNGVYQITASYIDHGIDNDNKNRLEGKDVVLIKKK